MGSGKVQSIARVKQPILFEGMRYNNITGTDIDFFIEARRAYVIGEFKYGDKPLDYGQRLALENLARDLHPRPTLLFVASHDVPTHQPVVAAECRVTEVQWRGVRLADSRLSNIRSVKHLVDTFIAQYTNLATNLPESAQTLSRYVNGEYSA